MVVSYWQQRRFVKEVGGVLGLKRAGSALPRLLRAGVPPGVRVRGHGLGSATAGYNHKGWWHFLHFGYLAETPGAHALQRVQALTIIRLRLDLSC